MTFASLPGEWLLIAAAAAAAGWEWLRAFFLARPGRATARRVGVALAVGAAGGWGLAMLLAASAVWALAVLAAAGVAWAVRSYRQTTAPLSPRARLALRLLRGAVLLLAPLLAAGLVWHDRVEEPVREGLALLVDTSRSMASQDVPFAGQPVAGVAALSRIAAVESALFAQQPLCRRLAERYDLRIAGFDERLRYAAAAELTGADGDRTAIGDAVQRAKDDFLAAGVPIAGVCVISDGCNNTADIITPLAQAEAMAARGSALWLVGVGNDVAGRRASLNVRDLEAPPRIDVMQEMPVAVDVEGVGLAGVTVLVQCRLGEQLVGAREVLFDQPVQTRRLRLTAMPITAGFQRLSVTAQRPSLGERPLVGELEQSRIVHVTSRTFRVLYLEGRRRTEGKFIAAALAGEERFALTRRLLAEPLGQQDDPQAARAYWQGYHVVLLGDCPAAALGWAHLEQLRRLVAEEGRAVVMLGGRASFTGGGWADSPLAAALPVELPRPAGPDAPQLPGPITVVPTAEGLAEGPLRLGGQGDAAAQWRRLRPLPGADVLGRPKPAATVLAQSADGAPLIVAQQYGAGRTLAVALDSTWRWALAPDDTAELQKRFWRQVLLWAANPSPDAWVTTDSPRYDERRLAAGEERITVRAGVESADGAPLAELPVMVTLTWPDGRSAEVNLAAWGPVRQAVLEPLPAGAYSLELSAESDGRALSARHAFEVIDRDLETADVVANLPLLRQMGLLAEPAGGGYRPLSDLAGVLERFAVGRPAAVRQRTIRVDLVDRHRWQLVVLLLVLLSAEWAARKRAGLV